MRVDRAVGRYYMCIEQVYTYVRANWSAGIGPRGRGGQTAVVRGAQSRFLRGADESFAIRSRVPPASQSIASVRKTSL